MPRQPKPAFGLGLAALALSLALGSLLATRAWAAQETSKAPAKEAGHAQAPPAATPSGGETHQAAGHHEEGGANPNILEPQLPLAIWTVAVFLGLLFVLGKFAWKPLLAALHAREEHLEHVLLETERARNESERLLAEHGRRLAAAEDQVRALIDEARGNARAAGDEIVKKAQAEAESSKVRAEKDIASARDQALSEIWSKTADLAVSVAGKVLGKTLSEDDHRRLIDSAVGELPATTNGHGGRRA
jgi:F-type H+-transporting ATPase subunit b